jgi:hypothetical protein
MGCRIPRAHHDGTLTLNSGSFLPIVIAGLDPAIQEYRKQAGHLRVRLDCRVKPGNDKEG